MQEYQTLANWLSSSAYTVVFTGAGMSTESGIPDFRSRQGLWRKFDANRVASLDALFNSREQFMEFYRLRLQTLEQCVPNDGHLILAEWERRGIVHGIVTQNVDGLHQQAGSKNVYELHGSLRSFRCHGCNNPAQKEEFVKNLPCPLCHGPLRPNVVLFGETLPQHAWDKAQEAMKVSELVLIIGTSMQVYPANTLPLLTNGKIAMINEEKTVADNSADLILRGRAVPVLKQVNALLQ